MIGGYYPFFMTNEELGDTGYVYQISSPNYNKVSLRPYITMNKVCDRTFSEKGEKIVSRENDVLFAALDDKYREMLKDEEGNIDRSKVNWVGQVKRLIDAKGTRVLQNTQRDGFPLIEITGYDTYIQKNLIVNLRSDIRWRKYNFAVGKKVDLLYAKGLIAVFELTDADPDNYGLKPVGLYKTTDITLKDNLLAGTCLETAEIKTYSKRIPELLSELRKYESKFYDRRDI